jgi:ABC-type branched-subunit amino acid transport system ATPase component
MPLLEVERLSKRFGGVRAVHDVSFVLEEGELLGIMGPNGSGKTTLFNLIVHLYDSSAGAIRFGDPPVDLTRLATHEINARGIARTFQMLRLFANMTVAENVLVGMNARLHPGLFKAIIASPRTRREEAEAEAEALELLSLFGHRLISMYNEPAASLSYANRRRLEIARALASRPALLLLDEPAAGMNPTETREIMADIAAIHDRGCTILLIEHDMGLVEGLAHRVVAIDHGAKIAEGSYREVCSDPEVIKAYLGSGAKANGGLGQ